MEGGAGSARATGCLGESTGVEAEADGGAAVAWASVTREGESVAEGAASDAMRQAGEQGWAGLLLAVLARRVGGVPLCGEPIVATKPDGSLLSLESSSTFKPPDSVASPGASSGSVGGTGRE